MSSKNILFFADRLPPLIGGMEIHAYYFIKHFTNHPQFPLLGIMTKNDAGEDCLIINGKISSSSIEKCARLFNPTFIFFNSGRWIEKLTKIRALFPKSIFIYRTGGNEILKAPLSDKRVSNHSLRQRYWVNVLNNTMHLLISNSSYTEQRLRAIGITLPFLRCIGGVNTAALQPCTLDSSKILTLVCAARFVPYKNHSLLLIAFQKLIERGHLLKLKLIGDGPLFNQVKRQAVQASLINTVDFLGALDHQRTCQEISSANIYIQFSADQLTGVPGGTYIHSEGMGRSILEALSAGVFVIAGRSGALPEIITPSRGLLVELDNIEQTVDRIDSVLRNLPKRLPPVKDFCWKKIFNYYEAWMEKSNENISSDRKM